LARLASVSSRAALVFGALELGALGCNAAEVPALSAPPSPPPPPASAAPPPAASASVPDAGPAAEVIDASFPRATVAIYGAPPPPSPQRPKK